MTYKIPAPDLQVDFSLALAEIRNLLLQDALSATVRTLDITEVDKQLAAIVPKESLAALAGHGLRGELLFPVSLVLEANPRLLGYYRLLYGFSKKEFYTKATGVGRFESLEKKRGAYPRESRGIGGALWSDDTGGNCLIGWARPKRYHPGTSE
jgi:hypothetical protein